MDYSSLGGRVGVSGLVANSPVGAPGPPCRWRYSYQIGRVEVLVPPGYRGSGPRPAAVGVTELGGVAGAAEGKRSANGTWPPRGPLEDWSGPVVGLTSESRVQVTLIRVAARPVRNVRAGQRGLLCGERARQLSESNLRGLRMIFFFSPQKFTFSPQSIFNPLFLNEDSTHILALLKTQQRQAMKIAESGKIVLVSCIIDFKDIQV